MTASPDGPGTSAARARDAGLTAIVLAVATGIAGRPWTLSSGWTLPHRDAAFDLVARVHLEEALLGRASWRESWLGHPLADAVALTDWALGPALLDLPLRALGVAPGPATFVLVFIGLYATAFACARLAAALTGEGPHTWVAGVAGGLSAAHLAHVQHVNLVHHELLAGGLLAAGTGIVRGRPLLAAAGGLALGVGGHFGAYIGVHSAVVGAVGLAVVFAARVGALRERLAAAAGFVVGLATFAPVAAVYTAFATRHGYGLSREEVFGEAWDPAYSLLPSPRVALHAALARVGIPLAPPRVDPDNLGYAVTALGILGLLVAARERRSRVAAVGLAAAVAVALLLALGPEPRLAGVAVPVPSPAALVPAALAGRGPARWLAVVAVVGAPFVGWGARVVLARVPRGGRSLAGAVLVAALLAELPQADVAPAGQDVARDPVYAAVAAIPGEGALAERVTDRCEHDAVDKLRAILVHRRPVVGGQYARAFPAAGALNRVASAWPGPEALVLFREVGVRVVLEHPPLRPLPAGLDPAITCSLVSGHRLCVLPVEAPRWPARVREAGPGPWIGVRWATPPEARAVVVACDGHTEAHSPFPWAALTAARDGAGAGVDLLLDAPCVEPPRVSAPGGVPLAAAP